MCKLDKKVLLFVGIISNQDLEDIGNIYHLISYPERENISIKEQLINLQTALKSKEKVAIITNSPYIVEYINISITLGSGIAYLQHGEIIRGSERYVPIYKEDISIYELYNDTYKEYKTDDYGAIIFLFREVKEQLHDDNQSISEYLFYKQNPRLNYN